MTDDDRQGLRDRLRPGKPARTRRAGEPNVLTGAATPNQLSGQGTRAPDVRTGTSAGAEAAPVAVRPVTSPPAAVNPMPASPAPGRSIPQSDAPAGGRRLPAIPTLIFLGFLGLTAFRLFGEFLEGVAVDSTPGPAATAVTPGQVRFGTGVDDDCSVTGEATDFTAPAEVWWSAEMATRQKASVTVVVITRRDGEEIEREVVPPDGSSATWEVLCSGGPVTDGDPGSYRLEVWNQEETVLQSAGEYTVAPGSS